MRDTITEIRYEISNAQCFINKLIAFKNNKSPIHSYASGGTISFYNYTTKHIRYTYRFRNFRENGEDFPTIKKYKSINKILHDLKVYIRKLQRQYSIYSKALENF